MKQTPTLEAIKQFPSAEKAFQARKEGAIAERDRYRQTNRDAHLIVGRVQFEGDDDPETVDSQMVVVEEGFFVDVIRDLNRPIGFRHFDYKPLDFMVPEDATPTEDGIIDVGLVQMTRSTPDEKGSIIGKLNLEDADDSRPATVNISLSNIRANTPSGGTEGIGRKYQRMTAKIDREGNVRSEPVSEGDYYISLTANGYVSTSRQVTVQAGKDVQFEPVELELPQKIDITFRVLKTDDTSFSDCPEMVTSIPGGHRWQAVPQQYGWDLEFKQSDGKIEFNYSYAPCYIKDLGEGTLEDHLDVLPDTATESPREMKLMPGHVYLLNQKAWKHAVLFRAEIQGKVNPGEEMPSGLATRADSPRLPNVIAHYDFEGNANELNGTGSAFVLKNTEFENGALKLNGQYELSPPSGYQAIASTPEMDYESFMVAIRFKAESFAQNNRTILCGGPSYRWLEIHATLDNSVALTFNNGQQSRTFQKLKLRTEKWHRIICAVDIPKKMVAMVLDDKRPEVFQLSQDFQLDVIGSNAEESDRKWTFTNYSIGNTFHGLVDELTILKGTMSEDEFKKTIASLKEKTSSAKTHSANPSD